jgi:hypothetical protein
MSLLEKASLIVTPNAYKTSKLYSVVPNTTLGDMDVVRATTATRVNSSGLISSVGVNIPRIDYTNGSCPSILVEPQRTNLALRSEEFDNATWTTNGLNVTVSPNTTTSPDGTNSADAILTTTTNGLHYIQQRTGSAIAGTTYTMSVYVKKLGYDYCRIQTSNTGTGIATFRFSTKTLTIDGPQVVANSGKVTEMADGWFRIQMSILPLASASWRWWVICLNDSAQESFTGDVTKGLYAWGFQFEVGSNATSYIPTVAFTVTRNADFLTKAGFGNTSASGTLFLDFYANNIESANGRYMVQLFAGSTVGDANFSAANCLSIISLNAGVEIRNNGFSQTVQTIVPTKGQRIKIAIRYNGINISSAINGTLSSVLTDTSVGVKNALRINNGEQSIYGINSLMFFPSYLTTSELQSLTTI